MRIASSSDFAAFVRRRRLQTDLTQDELAHAVRKSRRWVHDLETGKVDPSLGAAVDVAAALGFTVSLEPSGRSAILDQLFEDL